MCLSYAGQTQHRVIARGHVLCPGQAGGGEWEALQDRADIKHQPAMEPQVNPADPSCPQGTPERLKMPPAISTEAGHHETQKTLSLCLHSRSILMSFQGSRNMPGLSAATLASLGGTSSRRGSGDTSISLDTEPSIREIKVRGLLPCQVNVSPHESFSS